MADDLKQHLINEHGYWGELATHPRTDWQYEVANGDTLEGYWDWAIAKQADDEPPPQPR